MKGHFKNQQQMNRHQDFINQYKQNRSSIYFSEFSMPFDIIVTVSCLFPQQHFYRGKIFLIVIALLATGNDIALRALAPSRHRHNVIHGQFIPGKFPPAVITYSGIELILPPLALAQFFGFRPFPGDMFFIFLNGNPVAHAEKLRVFPVYWKDCIVV